MKQFKSFGLVVVTLLFSVTMAFAAKPNIHILATGGTIAGTGSSATGTSYTAGQVAICSGVNFAALPELTAASLYSSAYTHESAILGNEVGC